MAIRLKTIAVNSLIVIFSTVVCYLAVELIFFKVLFTNVHLGVRPYLPETAGALAQSTKAGPVPHDYVAILGDSYAQGFGDWSLSIGEDQSRAFHSPHAIHEMTGRDVVTFGRAGAGSAEAYVLLPSRALNGSRCLIFPTIGDPDQILAYFYEGNDIEDNLRFDVKVRVKYGRSDASAIDAYLSSEYAAYPWWRCHAQLGDIASRMARFLYEYYTGVVDPPSLARDHPNAVLTGGNIVPSSTREGPPGFLIPAPDIAAGMLVFERSLLWLHKRFPRTAITVVYIASPLALYRQAGPEVVVGVRRFPSDQLARESGRICNFVRDITAREQVGFFNPGPVLREAASTRAMHGPLDWYHFNKDGYRVFGDALARRLPEPAKVDGCGG
jgi:hypothetical protein